MIQLKDTYQVSANIVLEKLLEIIILILRDTISVQNQKSESKGMVYAEPSSYGGYTVLDQAGRDGHDKVTCGVVMKDNKTG